jgi:hypothetical protein
MMGGTPTTSTDHEGALLSTAWRWDAHGMLCHAVMQTFMLKSIMGLFFVGHHGGGAEIN